VHHDCACLQPLGARADGHERHRSVHVHAQLRLRQGLPRVWPGSKQGRVLLSMHEPQWLCGGRLGWHPLLVQDLSAGQGWLSEQLACQGRVYPEECQARAAAGAATAAFVVHYHSCRNGQDAGCRRWGLDHVWKWLQRVELWLREGHERHSRLSVRLARLWSQRLGCSETRAWRTGTRIVRGPTSVCKQRCVCAHCSVLRLIVAFARIESLLLTVIMCVVYLVCCAPLRVDDSLHLYATFTINPRVYKHPRSQVLVICAVQGINGDGTRRCYCDAWDQRRGRVVLRAEQHRVPGRHKQALFHGSKECESTTIVGSLSTQRSNMFDDPPALSHTHTHTYTLSLSRTCSVLTCVCCSLPHRQLTQGYMSLPSVKQTFLMIPPPYEYLLANAPFLECPADVPNGCNLSYPCVLPFPVFYPCVLPFPVFYPCVLPFPVSYPCILLSPFPSLPFLHCFCPQQLVCLFVLFVWFRSDPAVAHARTPAAR
jgi:hypothetical protein